MSPDTWSNLIHFAQQQWWLIALFVIVLLLILVEEGKSRGTGGGQVNSNQLVKLINDDKALVLDIRAKADFKKGHITGAISMPQGQFNVDAPILARSKNKVIVVVCVKGLSANRVALTLRKAGYDAKVLGGGIEAWKELSLPLKINK